MRKSTPLAVLVFILFFLAGALPALAVETAEDVYARIKTLLEEKRVLAAAREAVRMEPYKESEAYGKTEKLLRKIGISIGDPLKSYTVKQIIDLENHEERKRAASGDLPSPGSRPDYQDAWDMPLRIEMMSRPNILYLIRSAGPDRLFMSNDDLMIAVRAGAIPSKQGKSKTNRLGGAVMHQLTPEEMLREKGKRSMLQGKSAPRPGGGGARGLPGASGYGGGSYSGGGSGGKPAPQTPQPEEKSVSVDDLLKK